jgi:hypothetical protein
MEPGPIKARAHAVKATALHAAPENGLALTAGTGKAN